MLRDGVDERDDAKFLPCVHLGTGEVGGKWSKVVLCEAGGWCSGGYKGTGDSLTSSSCH